MLTPAKPVLKRLRGSLYTISDLCMTDEKQLEIAVFRWPSGFSDNCDEVAQVTTFERYTVRKTNAAPISLVV